MRWVGGQGSAPPKRRPLGRLEICFFMPILLDAESVEAPSHTYPQYKILELLYLIVSRSYATVLYGPNERHMVVEESSH